MQQMKDAAKKIDQPEKPKAQLTAPSGTGIFAGLNKPSVGGKKRLDDESSDDD